MKDLIYKEFKLSIHPSMFFFLAFGILLLIPSWPFFIAFGYLFIGIMNTFFLCRSNQDVFFTAMLPVRKRDTVRARVYSITLLELLEIAAAVPFAILHRVLFTFGNTVGMNINFAFFGFVFLMYGVFNIIFLPWFYKTAYKAGVALFVTVMAVVVLMTGVEIAVAAVPALHTTIGAFGTGHLGSQLIALAAGMGLFAGLTSLAYKQSARNFEKVDL